MKATEYIVKNKSLLILLVSLVLGLYLGRKNTSLEKKISKFEQQQVELEKQNKTLISERAKLLNQIEVTQSKIKELELKDAALTKEKEAIQTKLNKIKKDYEKANNHSVNFTSDSIRSYFSNF